MLDNDLVLSAADLDDYYSEGSCNPAQMTTGMANNVEDEADNNKVNVIQIDDSIELGSSAKLSLLWLPQQKVVATVLCSSVPHVVP
jgi:hypothetical protein